MDEKAYESPSITVTSFEFDDVIAERLSGGGIVLPPDEFSLGLDDSDWY